MNLSTIFSAFRDPQLYKLRIMIGIIVVSKINVYVAFFSFVGEEGYVSPGLPGRNIGHHPLARIINHRISRDRKERAIALFREMDLKSIAHLLDVSTRSIPDCLPR